MENLISDGTVLHRTVITQSLHFRVAVSVAAPTIYVNRPSSAWSSLPLERRTPAIPFVGLASVAKDLSACEIR